MKTPIILSLFMGKQQIIYHDLKRQKEKFRLRQVKKRPEN